MTRFWTVIKLLVLCVLSTLWIGMAIASEAAPSVTQVQMTRDAIKPESVNKAAFLEEIRTAREEIKAARAAAARQMEEEIREMTSILEEEEESTLSKEALADLEKIKASIEESKPTQEDRIKLRRDFFQFSRH